MVQIRRAIILQLGGLLVTGLLFFFLSRLFPVVDILSDVQQHVMRWGAWSAIWYPVLYACCNVLLLPGGVLSVGASCAPLAQMRPRLAAAASTPLIEEMLLPTPSKRGRQPTPSLQSPPPAGPMGE